MNLKIKLLTLAFIVLGVMAFIFPPKKKEMKTYSPSEMQEGFVVMELFTSQGCSSCPPADNLLGKYAAANNERIIPLAFHVDYWNRLGWTDSFSSAKYTNRQQNYSMMINNSSVYTPQLVLNGTKELVGSEAAKVAAYVETALKNKPSVSVTIDKAERTGKKISVRYTLNQVPANTLLNAALVQKEVVTNILKGENRGLKLTNYNVVRDFLFTHINSTSSSLELTLPDGYDEKSFSIVLYVQENATGKIIGAVKKDL